MYPLVKIPQFATRNFYAITKQEARQYLDWFLSIKDERILTLQSQVTRNWPGWRANYSIESLKNLYTWFVNEIEYRAITEEERKGFEDQIAKTLLFVNVIAVPEITFTDETVSICFDCAIYVAEVLLHQDATLRWLQKLNSTNYIDYAQPLIGNRGKQVPINPRRVVEGLARQVLNDSTEKLTFEFVCSNWLEKFRSSS